MNTYSVVVIDNYQPSAGDKFYQSERVVATCLTELDAKLQAAEYNIKRTEGTIYIVRLEN
jgi:hypothetical protein